MDLIKEINEKYSALEEEIDNKLERVQTEEQKLENEKEKLADKAKINMPATKVLSYEEALLRNTNTLKSLEIAKARLRSRTTYSPVEKLLQQAMDNYKKELEGIQKKHEGKPDKLPANLDVDDEDDNLYELVMQNVIEKQHQQQHNHHHHQQQPT
ncbi:uncharacterized protein Dwil_GK24440 [Drosophila willistoni]|uniref:Uncharacterized protein n=1 Tax=Drosophila willistoni TaxID=7260 RepID=B4N0Q0_DROWI|nr:uncharacterized protein LOC6644380 [Drosophila willistoni]EDW77663.1 uncharacterized protein Dwil_GK24440 [Drosophila willistoni]